MTPSEFIAKWKKSTLTERSSSHQHFLDLCDLLQHDKPAAVDATGDEFTFEKGAAKLGGGDGWADVWKKGFFAWEYKGKHKDLDAAYKQLLEYRESLENPPLLVVSDINRILIHTNFTSTPHRVYEIPLPELGTKTNLNSLSAVFFEPDKLKPGIERKVITTEAAAKIGAIAQTLRNRGLDPHEIANFLDRIIFCLFAEDTGLLPNGMFSKIADKGRNDPTRFTKLTGDLFAVMAKGGDFGVDTIRHFNGSLFDGGRSLDLTADEIEQIWLASRLDWGAVDPSIFGTLFERGLDPDKRSQLGAHYTSREDIETLVEPVVIQPLHKEWETVRDQVEALLDKETTKKDRARKADEQKADKLLHDFIQRLARVTVLDPACGSGNFLYVALQKMKNLEQQVIEYALSRALVGFLPMSGPWQLYGIEINMYACDLARMTVWIGYLQWLRDQGYQVTDDPVLRATDNFQCKDAILDLSDPDNTKEPEWPAVDCIVGNPPFLGGKKMRSELTDGYVDKLFSMWKDRVRPEADLCCYWFEKARAQIEQGRCSRAGLLATQGIRGGANRETLKRIKDTGEIFFAVSDRDWILDGANVHVSLIGFDDGAETEARLDDQPVAVINANLTSTVDVSMARPLVRNFGIAFMGDTKGGPFDIAEDVALNMMRLPNPNGRPNSDVVVPWANGLAVTRRESPLFIIDFGTEMPEQEASAYEAPFEYVREHVWPERKDNNREAYRVNWWRHVEARSGWRAACLGSSRFISTPRVAKHRLFVWMMTPTLPDSALIAFARSDNYFLGVLHSRLHEVWALRQGTRLETRPRYTPTTCFETFPFPKPTPEQEAAIAQAAKELDEMRNNWLNPREWTKEEVLEFPGSADGPWARYVAEPDTKGIGTVRYPRIVPKDAESADQLKKRTLTNLYNQRPTWLDLAHRKLDGAVFAAYGWDPSMTDEQILEALLRLNLERADE